MQGKHHANIVNIDLQSLPEPVQSIIAFMNVRYHESPPMPIPQFNGPRFIAEGCQRPLRRLFDPR